MAGGNTQALRYNAMECNGQPLALGADLATGATSITFADKLTYQGGTNVPTLANDAYLRLELWDTRSQRYFPHYEIVWLTAYTAGATTGTIARAKEGTSDPGVTHAMTNTSMVHSSSADDFTRPTVLNAFLSRSVQIGGNITLAASQTQAEVAAATGGPGTGGLDLTVAAATNDVLEIATQLIIVTNSTCSFDIATMVSGSPVNWLGQSAGSLWSTNNGLITFQTGELLGPTGPWLYTVQSGDISSGQVTLRLYYGSGTGTRVLARSAGNGPLLFSVKNLRQ